MTRETVPGGYSPSRCAEFTPGIGYNPSRCAEFTPDIGYNPSRCQIVDVGPAWFMV